LRDLFEITVRNNFLTISELFIRDVKGQYAENQKITAIRKIYKKGLATPMANIDQLWADYCAYEKV
jgi:hypothetical protein